MRIFGREPSLVLQSIGAVLSVLVAVGLPGLSAEQAALIVAGIAAVFGVLNAIAVRPLAPAAFTGLVTAAAALLAAYGFDVSQTVVGAIGGAVPVLLALFVRGQSTPNSSPAPLDRVVG